MGKINPKQNKDVASQGSGKHHLNEHKSNQKETNKYRILANYPKNQLPQYSLTPPQQSQER